MLQKSWASNKELLLSLDLKGQGQQAVPEIQSCVKKATLRETMTFSWGHRKPKMTLQKKTGGLNALTPVFCLPQSMS